MAELRREEVTEFPVKTACLGCGREVTLWFNGGELDSDFCCGRVYRLEHASIQFVITEAE